MLTPRGIYAGDEYGSDVNLRERGNSGRDITAEWTDVWRQRDLLAEAEALGHLGAWSWDMTTHEMEWSDEVYRILGVAPGAFAPTHERLVSFFHPDDAARIVALMHATAAGGPPYLAEHRVVRPSGEVRHVRARGIVSPTPDSPTGRIAGIVLDITEEHELRRAPSESEELHRLLATNAYDVIWTMDLDGAVSYVSPSVERVRGITPEEARAQTLDQIHPPESAARVADYFGRLFTAIATGGELPGFRGEQEYYRKDGSIMHGELQVIPQVDSDGKPVRILGVTRDISERKELEAELKRLAVTDPVTGVWNRRRGEEALRADMAESRRYGPALALLMVDIDHFKAVNDTHGHQAGDTVLRELCRRLADHLRPSDSLIRWGGEEFVILARQCGLDAGVALAEKVRALVASDPFDAAGPVTVSIGVAEFLPDDDLDAWLGRADAGLYAAKAAGRNTVRIA